jgi:hypothetical protein
LTREVFAKVGFFSKPPSCPSGILPPKGAGYYCGATNSLAPIGGKGLRKRGLEYKPE